MNFIYIWVDIEHTLNNHGNIWYSSQAHMQDTGFLESSSYKWSNNMLYRKKSITIKAPWNFHINGLIADILFEEQPFKLLKSYLAFITFMPFHLFCSSLKQPLKNGLQKTETKNS
jgi:hypothetical protein